MNAGPEPIEAVIFDIGGVLLEYDFELAVRAAVPLTGLSADEIRRRLFGAGGYASTEHRREVLDFECGRLSGEQFHAFVQQLLGCRIPFPLFCQTWNCIFKREIEPTVALLRRLQRAAGLKVGGLSNTNVIHYEYIRRRWSVLREIEYMFASHEIGHRKPDPACFQHVLKEMGVAAPRAVFVDDFSQNVAGARSAGMLGVHAPNHEAVHAGLAALGLSGL
ncbi:MAG: HAD family phosphatase [Planctomycetota bacterium]